MFIHPSLNATLSRDNLYPVETTRVLAIFLVVIYHVIGVGPAAGLQISPPHPTRFLADFMIDIHMPVFAFISGYVYALKPPASGYLPRFLGGKIRRLVIPGIIAITAFMTASHMTGTAFAPESTWWKYYYLPYAHFWFLQAILLIFIVYGGFDMITGGRWLHISFALSLGLYLFGPLFSTNVMSVNQAIYLLPYFIFGITFCRHPAFIAKHDGKIALIAGAFFALAVAANFLTLETTGSFSLNKYDLQSLATGLSIPVVCLLLMPNIAMIDRLSPAIFTIYLYHIFGTSLMRRGLDAIGVDEISIHLVLGTAAGVILPLMIHQAAMRHLWTRRLILGQRE